MDVQTLQALCGWSSLINYAVLVIWVGSMLVAPGQVYRLHGRFFALSRAQFDTIHYAGMALYKLLIFVFNLVPWIVLRFLV